MSQKQRLELNWVGKEKRPRLEPRILLDDQTKSYHANARVTENDIFDNRLIFGDNLLALKALEQEFTGKVKCIYIDPPFNTGGAFKHYDDNLEHSIWLSLMRDRLQILHRLLSPDGALVVNLDDSEMAYCKVVLDEIFGRSNYILTIVVEAATPSSFKTVNTGPTEVVQYLLFYAKEKTKFTYHPQYIASYEVDLSHFSRFIVNFEQPAKDWVFQSINDHILGTLGFKGDTANAKWSAAKKELGAEQAVEKVKSAATAFALENCHRVFETKTMQKPSKWLHDHIKKSMETDFVIDLPRDGKDNIYLYKGRQLYFLGKGVHEIDGEKVVVQPLSNLWDDIPTNNLQKEGGVDFPGGKKPEALVSRIIKMITVKNDLVLDSFGGSGTTAAVAHKMHRRWITIEMGEHCNTHIIPRLKNVINNNDASGITDSVQWRGGGGFRFYQLAPSLLEKDRFGNWVIAQGYNAAMLAEAVCKLMGFTYAPSQQAEEYWKHGHSTETDFIFVTTQALTHDALKALSEEVGPNRTLLICCKAFNANEAAFDNLTLRKIPKAVLDKCEWGRDDYSLAISSLPPADDSDDEPSPPKRRGRKSADSEPSLFYTTGEE
jgi:adenine-specific DNA-methyltransferase